MSTLALSFSDVYTEVSKNLGYGSSPSATNLATCKAIVNRAYRRFLFPCDPATGNIHQWSFLRKDGSLILPANEYRLDLPLDYITMVVGPKFFAGENLRNPEATTEAKIYGLRTNSVGTGTPKYYCVKSGTFSKDTGQKYEILFWKVADAAYNYKFVYYFEPVLLDSSTDILLGGAMASEVILQMSLATGEFQENEEEGIDSKKAVELLNSLIIWDKANNPMPAMERDPNIKKIAPVKE